MDRWNNDELAVFLARQGTVLGLGDSFTYGHGVRYEDTYLRRLEKRMARESPGIEIINTAFPGFDLEEVVRTYSIESAAQPYPLVVYGFVLNDFGLPRQRVTRLRLDAGDSGILMRGTIKCQANNNNSDPFLSPNNET